MWTDFFFIQLITSFIGSLAFAGIFKIRPKHLFLAGLGGALTYFVYYVVEYSTLSLFAAAFFSSLVSAIYSEICARTMRAPAVIFLLPCAIPIVPGGSLYHTMFNLISKNVEIAWKHFANTITVAIGIAGGIAAVSLIFHIITSTVAHYKTKKKSSSEI